MHFTGDQFVPSFINVYTNYTQDFKLRNIIPIKNIIDRRRLSETWTNPVSNTE